jgi:opacity protein-like surface antigen
MSKRMLGAITVCLFLSTAPVYAQDEEYVRSGVYFIAAASYAVEQFDRDERSTDFRNSFGAGARLGYRLHPLFAAEAQYEWIAGFDEYGLVSEEGVGPTFIDCGEDPEACLSRKKIKAGEIIAHTATVNVKVFPLGGRIQPYALVGVGVGSSEINQRERTGLDGEDLVKTDITTQDQAFVSRYGLGVDLYGDDAWGMFAEAAYILPTGSLRELDYISVQWGLLWRF